MSRHANAIENSFRDTMIWIFGIRAASIRTGSREGKLKKSPSGTLR